MPPARKPRRSLRGSEDLYRRWRVALADAGTTNRAWAINRGLTPSHVRQVVLGVGGRESRALLEEIVHWIEGREAVLAKRLAVTAA